MKIIAFFLLKYRYFISCLILLILMVFHTLNGHHLSGDIWSHSAAVRELATNLYSPGHSHYSIDAPTILYSPYSLLIAFVSRITQLDAVTTLSLAGIFNLILFLYGLRLFVSLLIPRHSESAPFYTLLFTMILWGNDAWLKSGFFHIRVLGGVLQLPSAFGFSLALIALSIFILYTRNRNRVWFIPLTIIAIIVLISHPLSFIFLTVGLISLSFGKRRLPLSDYGLLILIFIAIVAVTAIWPYAPFIKLLFLKSVKTYSSHAISKTLYQGVLIRIFPALIGIPFLIARIRANRWDPLGIMFGILCLIYACGAIFEKWAFGRMISFIVLVLHISIAGGIAQVESKLEDYCRNVKKKIGAEQLLQYIGILAISGALTWGCKKLFLPLVYTSIQLKSIVFLLIALLSVFLTWFLFRPSGWFCQRTLLFKKSAFTLLILTTCITLSINDYVRPALAALKPAHQDNYSKHLFMRTYIGQYDVVLSDLSTSGVIPTFGGKVVAVANTPVSIADNDLRIKDVEDFFSATVSYDNQLKILNKYRIDFLLISKSHVPNWQDLTKTFSSLGRVVYTDDEFILLSLDSLKEE